MRVVGEIGQIGSTVPLGCDAIPPSIQLVKAGQTLLPPTNAELMPILSEPKAEDRLVSGWPVIYGDIVIRGTSF